MARGRWGGRPCPPRCFLIPAQAGQEWISVAKSTRLSSCNGVIMREKLDPPPSKTVEIFDIIVLSLTALVELVLLVF